MVASEHGSKLHSRRRRRRSQGRIGPFLVSVKIFEIRNLLVILSSAICHLLFVVRSFGAEIFEGYDHARP